MTEIEAKPSSQGQARRAVADLLEVWPTRSAWFAFALNDVKQRYRRAALGRLWIVIAVGVTVLTVGIIYASVMNQPIESYLPYIAVGMVVWYLMAGVLAEAPLAFIGSEGLIKAVRVPRSFFVARTITKHLLIFGMNLSIVLLVHVLYPPRSLAPLALFPLGLILLILNLSWIVLLAGSLAARFRDIVPLSGSAVQILFLITPVIYRPEQLAPGLGLFSAFNPLANLISIVRDPLLGQSPSSWAWGFCAVTALAGWSVAFLVFVRARRMIAVWL